MQRLNYFEADKCSQPENMIQNISSILHKRPRSQKKNKSKEDQEIITNLGKLWRYVTKYNVVSALDPKTIQKDNIGKTCEIQI
jgi:hypothetical protein